jgi:hypothetical protein
MTNATYQSADDCPLGEAHGTASTHGNANNERCCDFCGFPVAQATNATPGPVEVTKAEKLFDAILGNVSAYGEWGTPSYREAALREISAAFARHRIEAARPVSEAGVEAEPIGYIIAEMLNRKSEFERSGIVMTAAPQGMSTLPLYTSPPVQSELVEALKGLLKYEGHHVYCGHAPDYDKPCVCGFNEADAKARALIAKATGDGL